MKRALVVALSFLIVGCGKSNVEKEVDKMKITDQQLIEAISKLNREVAELKAANRLHNKNK